MTSPEKNITFYIVPGVVAVVNLNFRKTTTAKATRMSPKQKGLINGCAL